MRKKRRAKRAPRPGQGRAGALTLASVAGLSPAEVVLLAARLTTTPWSLGRPSRNTGGLYSGQFGAGTYSGLGGAVLPLPGFNSPLAPVAPTGPGPQAPDVVPNYPTAPPPPYTPGNPPKGFPGGGM